MLRDRLRPSRHHWPIALLAGSALVCATSALAQSIVGTGNITPAPASPQPSPWNVPDDLNVGDTATGTLAISGGGVVTSAGGHGAIGYRLTGIGHGDG